MARSNAGEQHNSRNYSSGLLRNLDYPIRLSCQTNNRPRAPVRVRTIRSPDEAVRYYQITNDGIPPTSQRYDRDSTPISQSRLDGPVQPTELGRRSANSAIWDADNAPRRHRHKRSRTDIRCPAEATRGVLRAIESGQRGLRLYGRSSRDDTATHSNRETRKGTREYFRAPATKAVHTRIPTLRSSREAADGTLRRPLSGHRKKGQDFPNRQGREKCERVNR